MEYIIKKGSETYLGNKKALTLVVDNNEYYIELEPFEYKDTNDEMEYAESEAKVEEYLEAFVSRLTN